MLKQQIIICKAADNHKEQCESILRALPEWFGIESAIVQYAEDVRSMPTYVGVIDDRVCGFLSLHQHNSYAAEIHVMAVRREFHRHGLGKILIKKIEDICRQASVEYLQVKTLGDSQTNEYYDRTRNFYFHSGFRPLEEIKGIWGNIPCLLMIKKL